jgi:CelD/BcsL family acetyltransferase involved in cellulose biosynthesis
MAGRRDDRNYRAPVRTRILRGPHQWTTVGPAWTALAAEIPATAHVHLAEWAHALTDAAHDAASRWFIAEDERGPLAVMPYTVSIRRFGPLRVRVLANERLTDGLVADRIRPAALRAALLGASAGAGEPLDALSLNGLRPRSGFLRLATASAYGLETETRHGGHSVIETGVTGDEWFASSSRNLRASLRKARNRFERRGAMTITVATTPDAVAAAFDEYVAIESTGWKADTGALVNRPMERATLRTFFVTAAESGRVSARTLRLDGRGAAAQLASVTGDTLELLKVAYDDRLSDLSPSNLLMADLVRECCDRSDVARIDLLTNQPWHDRWHADEHPTYKARDLDVRRLGGLASRVAVALDGAGTHLPRA